LHTINVIIYCKSKIEFSEISVLGGVSIFLQG
jgi:hypothetical protein